MARQPKSAASELSQLGANLDADESDPVLPLAGEQRVRIMLEENDNIPPGGQFIQVGGSNPDGSRFMHSYMLQPGVAVDVPRDLVEVLDNAVESTPVKDAQDTVIGYRDKLRYPYRVLSKGAAARA